MLKVIQFSLLTFANPMKNPKKSLVRTLMLSSALAGGLTLAQSFYNEAQATSSGGATTPPSCKWASSVCPNGNPREVCLTDGNGNSCSCGTVPRPC